MVDHACPAAGRDDDLDHVHPRRARADPRGQRARRGDAPRQIPAVHVLRGPEAGPGCAGLDLDHDQELAGAADQVQLALGGHQAPGDRAQARSRQVARGEPLAGAPALGAGQARQRPARQRQGEEREGAAADGERQGAALRDALPEARQGARGQARAEP